ncbi:MAG: cyclic nucleotide-binding domain-containing protein [Planctomycetota bacterium]
MGRSRFMEAEVLEGLDGRCIEALAAAAEARTLDGGETLFRLGENATRLYVVGSGEVELTLPISLESEARELRVETRGPRTTVGWSALIPPHRFTLSARAVGPSQVFGLERSALEKAFGEDPHSGYLFMKHVCSGIGRRLVQVQALWARELRHAVGGEVGGQASTPQD